MVAKFNKIQIEIVDLTPAIAPPVDIVDVNPPDSIPANVLNVESVPDPIEKPAFVPAWGKKSGWSVSDILKEIRLDF